MNPHQPRPIILRILPINLDQTLQKQLLFHRLLRLPLIRSRERNTEHIRLDYVDLAQGVEIPIFTDAERTVGIAFCFVDGYPACIFLDGED